MYVLVKQTNHTFFFGKINVMNVMTIVVKAHNTRKS